MTTSIKKITWYCGVLLLLIPMSWGWTVKGYYFCGGEGDFNRYAAATDLDGSEFRSVNQNTCRSLCNNDANCLAFSYEHANYERKCIICEADASGNAVYSWTANAANQPDRFYSEIKPCTTGRHLVNSYCVCDTTNHFVPDENGGCTCDATNKFVPDENGGCVKCPDTNHGVEYGNTCVCDATNHFVPDGNACVCDATNKFVPDENGGCTCGANAALDSTSILPTTCVCNTGFSNYYIANSGDPDTSVATVNQCQYYASRGYWWGGGGGYPFPNYPSGCIHGSDGIIYFNTETTAVKCSSTWRCVKSTETCTCDAINHFVESVGGCACNENFVADSNNKCVCNTGYYLNNMTAGACTACTGNSQVQRTSVVQEWYEPSKYKSSDGTECALCRVGSDNSDGTGPCDSCIAGKSNAANGGTCQSCATGKYAGASTYGKATCDDCTGNFQVQTTTTVGGTYVSIGGTHCVACASGYDNSDGGACACATGSYEVNGDCVPWMSHTECQGLENYDGQLGQAYKPGTTTTDAYCVKCDKGYVAPAALDNTDETSCTLCSAGYGGYTSCTQCAVDTYQVHKSLITEPCADKHCPLGQGVTDETEFSNSSHACEGCVQGTYSNSTETGQCTVCDGHKFTADENGTYAEVNATQCLPCPAGTHQSPDGGVCDPCDPGQTSVAGGSCAPCSVNTFAANSNGFYTADSGATQCLPCPAGTYQPVNNSTSTMCHTVEDGKQLTLTGNDYVWVDVPILRPAALETALSNMNCLSGQMYQREPGNCTVGRICFTDGDVLECPSETVRLNATHCSSRKSDVHSKLQRFCPL